MQKAAFSIINYQFPNVSIDFSNHKNNELSISFDTKGVFNSSNSVFELIFGIKVISSNSESSFVELVCKGDFKFESISALSDVPDFFYRNSIALLFPYVRAYLSIVTTQANVPGVILPTLNLTGLEDELKKNTTQI